MTHAAPQPLADGVMSLETDCQNPASSTEMGKNFNELNENELLYSGSSTPPTFLHNGLHLTQGAVGEELFSACILTARLEWKCV